MENAIETHVADGLKLEIFQDTDAQSPREDSNLGIMVCFHKRYNLGDKTDIKHDSFDSWSEIEKYLKKEKKAIMILPLYLYDHSGLRMKIGSFNGLLPQGHAEFDSGMVGFIYTTKEKLEETGVKNNKNEIARQLEGEVDTYDSYLSGDVYGYKITKEVKCDKCGHVENEDVDSCWGFVGYDSIKNMADNFPPEAKKLGEMIGKKEEKIVVKQYMR